VRLVDPAHGSVEYQKTNQQISAGLRASRPYGERRSRSCCRTARDFLRNDAVRRIPTNRTTARTLGQGRPLRRMVATRVVLLFGIGQPLWI